MASFEPPGHVHPWRHELGIPERAIAVGHIGRFAPVKRQADLFEAASLLRLADPPLYFAFAGRGPLFDGFRAGSSANPRIIMLSNVEDIAAFLRSLDIVVLCSADEGAPQSLLEAIACGKAIVSTRVGGIAHMVGGNGAAPAARLVPPMRPDRLAEAILALACDAQLRAGLGALARRRAEACSFEREWARYAALYSAVTRH